MIPADEGHIERLQTPVGTRRRFFQRTIGLVAALIGGSLAIPLVGYVISPALQRRPQPWVDVGAVDELRAGEPKQLEYVTAVQDGWLETKNQKAVWALKRADGDITVFSPICPHLGCGYRWDDSENQFKCPCHLSVYDVTGKVLGGPAPRPLDMLPAKVENGRLFVIYKEFKAGLSIPVEL